MKILYVSQAYLPSQTSNSLSIMRMCQAFSDCGHEVTLTGIGCNKDTSEITKYYGLRGGFNIQTFFFHKLIGQLRLREHLLAFKIRKLAIELKPDIIYSRLCLSALAKLPSDLPVVFEMHSPGPVSKSGYHRRKFSAFLKNKNFRRIVVTTKMLKSYLIDLYPNIDIVIARLSSEHPTSINDVNLMKFKKDTIKGKNEFRVGYTGFLDNTGLRGTDIICKIAEKIKDVDFHIVGGTKPMVDYWSNYSASKNVYFYGHQNPSLIPLFLESFDIVLATLKLQKDSTKPMGKGMSPLKIPQYLACGCVIVASDIPAHLEILEHRKNAMICEVANIDQWVSTIHLLRLDEQLRNKISRNAYKTYLDDFTPEIRINKILSGIDL